jgi:hypothetical protein
MSIHLNKFVDRLRGFEARGVKDFTMSMSDAKDLHADITRLLLNLQTLQTAITTNVAEDQSIRVEIKGGTFK